MNSPPGLNTLEFLGAISARVAHALSNQMPIITGNLCIAHASLEDRQKLAEAIKGALKGANEAGELLARLVDLRRSVMGGSSRTEGATLVENLKAWTRGRPKWTFESEPALSVPGGVAIGISWEWLSFILTTMENEGTGTTGSIALHCTERKPSANTHAFYTDQTPIGYAEMRIVLPGRDPLDWPAIRRDMRSFALTAVYELLAQVGTTPESSEVKAGWHETRFLLPLF